MMPRFLLLPVLLVPFLGSVGCNPSARVGPTPDGYFFWLATRHPQPVSGDALEALSVELELVVSVEDGKGAPADGVLVEFITGSFWEGRAIAVPPRAVTREGKARSVFRAFNIGRAPIRVRVDTMTQEVMVNVTRTDVEEP